MKSILGKLLCWKKPTIMLAKILFSFSIWSYGKTQTNFLTNHLLYLKMYVGMNRCRIEERYSEHGQIYGKTTKVEKSRVLVMDAASEVKMLQGPGLTNEFTAMHVINGI